ncbi:MAG: 4Fe-4S dicluster domain-containing protein [Deltaproteobacteria bacterium]|nr:4Fe-4S dicluster domain-containing protein [Deltaproteobacteria bacterium]MBI2991861.1 4Fe-4S dicluster domain-containing protein [Deltaproteobacteria bacterium]
MKIDPQKCVACGNCLPVCPVGAIHVDPRLARAVVNEDECVECFACFRGMSKEHLNPVMVRAIRRVAGFFRFRFDPEPDICPTDAITPQELQWPRIVRRAFSDPQVPHESTGIHGRGTAEVKTNDVTGRVKEGEAGFVVEFGRPGVGARFRDIQRVTMALAACGVDFEKNNPVTSLMTDPVKGLIREDILDEKILSAIVEIKSRLAQVPMVLKKIRDLSREVDTVISVGVSTRCDAAGDDALRAILEYEGYPMYRGKTNLGLGRIATAKSEDGL